MTPFYTDDLTYVIWEENGAFAVFHSPDTAEHDADYFELARCPTREQAHALIGQASTA